MELGNMLFGNARGEHGVPRTDEWEEEITRLCTATDPDYDGYPLFYENDTFVIRGYWWGDEVAPEAELPNFHHKPSGFKMEWYKYPLRDSYMSDDIELSDLRDMIDECIESIGGGTLEGQDR